MTDLTKKSEELTRVGILLFCGFLSFMINPTAYTWGEQDMMPFFERFQDPDFLPTDFFTNSSMIKNPRWVYGYFIAGISAISGLSWYKILYLVKLLLLLSMPVLHYKVVMALLSRYVDREKLERISWFILFAIILTVVYTEYRQVFSVARWEHYKLVLNSANISMVICFVALLLKENKKTSLLYLPLFVIGVLFHPAMGVFCVAFYFSFLLPQIRKEWRDMLKITIVCLLTLVFVRLYFSSNNPLETAEFIEYYVVERHPWHYYVPKFDHWLGDWRYFFALMNLLLWGSLIYGLVKKDRNLIVLALISSVAYIASILLQYIFINIFPIKTMAYLGVSRYSIFGYWSVILLWAYILAQLDNKRLKISLPPLSSLGLLVLLLNFVFVGIIYLDNPREIKSRNWRDFYSFVHQTTPESTFLTFSEKLNTDLRIIGRRPVFIAREFPFVESEIKEHTMRQRLAYGSKIKGAEGIAFFRALSPEDYVQMAESYPLDYIVVEAKYSTAFEEYTPVWSNNSLKVYSLKALK